MAARWLDNQGKRTQNFLDLKIDVHRKRLIKSLEELEEEVIAMVSTLPKEGGNLFNVKIAIEKRATLKQLIEKTYLVTSDKNIRDYNTITKRIIKDLEKYKLPAKFGHLTQTDADTVARLKKLYFNQFKEAGTTIQAALSQEIYNGALMKRPIKDVIHNVRQKINGVYAKSDQRKIRKLVAIANEDPSSRAGKKAIEKLHSIYGSDRTGNNLKRYAQQISHDSVMQFHSQVNIAKAKEYGFTKWRYAGNVIGTTRNFCRNRIGKVYTEVEIRKIWLASSWSGKAPGDAFIVRGGYNCRHHWQPIDDSFLDNSGKLII